MDYHSDGWLAPCGSLISTSNDMAKYMMMYAQRNTNGVLTGQTLEEMLQPVVQMRDGQQNNNYDHRLFEKWRQKS